MGRRAISGSLATRLQELGHGLFAVEQGLVHVDVEHVGPAAHLVERDGQTRREIAGLDEVGELARAGHVGALADHDEVGLGEFTVSVSSPARRRLVDALRSAAAAARTPSTALAMARDVIRRGAAAAAHDVEQARLRPSRE